jgi:hypothetical protein
MRTGYVPIVAVGLVLGWAAPVPTQPDLGLAAQARVKAHTHKKMTKLSQAVQQRAVQKRVASKAIGKPSALPLRLASAAQQSSTSSSPSPMDLPLPPIPSNMVPSPPEPQVPTPDEHMEKLRVGLEKLARTYPSPEAHMEMLRLGLERLAKAMNGSRS